VQQSEHEHHEQTEHQPSLSWFDRQFAGIGVYRLLRPLIVGLVHGLAGSAAVALLVLATIRDARWAIAYLFVFGVGTIAGMMMITMAIAAPLIYSGRKFTRLSDVLRIASGAISLAFGLFLIYEIGFVNGLFTSHPNWTPH
jgi:high-affinity nickel-transport protein